jgi:hypothetical protein
MWLWCVLVLLATAGLLASACQRGPSKPKHRERAETRDTGCIDASKPSAYFYPADNRTDYKPDHPLADGCALLVADHLFCCPHAPRPTDR